LVIHERRSLERHFFCHFLVGMARRAVRLPALSRLRRAGWNSAGQKPGKRQRGHRGAMSLPKYGSLVLAGLGGFGMLMAFRRKKA
jgi:hypothetical protein